MFSEENYVPLNRKLCQQACLLLFIVSQWYRLESINYFKREHAQTQFWSSFEITKCWGYLEYKVINSLCLQKKVPMQVWWRSTQWFRRQSSEKADFTVFIRWWPWNKGQGHQTLYCASRKQYMKIGQNPLFCSRDNVWNPYFGWNWIF